MSLFHASDRISPALDRQAAVVRFLPFLYGLTLFVSALLLFSIQPMFAKMVLPKLGGAPAVWSVAMVFFQTVLLAGYAYAYVLNRLLTPRRSAMLHLVLLALTAIALPIAVAPGWSAPPQDGTALWLFGLFAVSIGLPFFTLSATAPLLQSWFAASGHRQAGNPYVLYAASNLGSFAALFAYPVVVEPFLTLKAQAAGWSLGFAACVVLLAGASLCTSDAAPVTAEAPSEDEASSQAIERLRWIALAAVPSGLVIAVTAHLTTDIAAAPFLWVLPLAIYLLTFVAVFRERPWIAHANVVWLVPFAVAPLAVSLIGGDKVFWLAMIALNLVAFALLTLMCHGELYARRPSPQRLTEFYLCTSFGGVIGGAFAGLLAPQIFNGNYEYPILIALALLCMPGFFAGGVRAAFVRLWPWLLPSAVLVLLWYVARPSLPATLELPFQVLLAILAAALLFQRQQMARFFALVVLSFTVTGLWHPGLAPIETARSFFGVHKVAELAEGKARILYHGTTIHGAQRLRNEDGTAVAGPPRPLTYYYLRTSGRSNRCRPRRPRRPRTCRRGRPRYGIAGLSPQGGRTVDVFRDRPGSDPHRPRSAPVHVHVELRGGCAGRGRRRPADAGSLARPVRLDRARRLLVRQHPDAPADPRGAGGLSRQALAARRHCRAHFQSPPRSGSRRCQRRAVAGAGRLPPPG